MMLTLLIWLGSVECCRLSLTVLEVEEVKFADACKILMHRYHMPHYEQIPVWWAKQCYATLGLASSSRGWWKVRCCSSNLVYEDGKCDRFAIKDKIAILGENLRQATLISDTW